MFEAPREMPPMRLSLAQVNRLSDQGHRLVISLGRFEPEGYKNSLAVYEVFARILEREPDARLLVLARPEDLQPPEALRHAVLPLGFLSDATLAAVMPRCALGLSLSRWEGFNLPLAEMQWCGRPVLAFNLAAHPEVAADPWLLCASLDEMADKAMALLQRGLPPHIVERGSIRALPEPFSLAGCHRALHHDYRGPRSRGGCAGRASWPRSPRAAGGLHQRLRRSREPGRDPGRPSAWPRATAASRATRGLRPLGYSLGSYRTLAAQERATLGSYNGPIDGISSLLSPSGQGVWPVDNILGLLDTDAPPVLFVPEVVLDGRFPERIAWARARGLLVAALLHDLIPVTHSPFFPAELVNRFPEYLESLAAADAIWADLRGDSAAVRAHIGRHNLPRPPEREAIWLPAQLGAQPRVTTPSEPP